MKNTPFTIEYPVLLNDISVDAKIRSWVIFNYLQDAAGRHADRLGLGLKQLRSSDLSWVLSRIRIKMDDFPEYGDILKITTYPSGFDRLFAYRQFVLSSAISGKRFGVAGSAWLTLNPLTFRPVSPAKHLTGIPQWQYDEEIFFQEDTLAKLIPPTEELEELADQTVSGAWIDYNRHLNNAFYAMFTEDALAKKSQSLIRMTELQLNFNNSTAVNERLLCSGTVDKEGFFYIAGTNEASGKNAFQARGVFSKIVPAEISDSNIQQ